MATMSTEAYFLSCASISAFDVSFIFLMPLFLLNQKEIILSSVSYTIISKVLKVLQTPTNELRTPITIFLPRDSQKRMIIYDAHFTDKS